MLRLRRKQVPCRKQHNKERFPESFLSTRCHFAILSMVRSTSVGKSW
jgi:hypothetical protein